MIHALHSAVRCCGYGYAADVRRYGADYAKPWRIEVVHSAIDTPDDYVSFTLYRCEGDVSHGLKPHRWRPVIHILEDDNLVRVAHVGDDGMVGDECEVYAVSIVDSIIDTSAERAAVDNLYGEG